MWQNMCEMKTSREKPFDLNGNLMYFAVDEFNQGDSSLNGNSASLDFVIHVFDHSTGISTNLGLAISKQPQDIIGDAGLVVFGVSEQGQNSFKAQLYQYMNLILQQHH